MEDFGSAIGQAYSFAMSRSVRPLILLISALSADPMQIVRGRNGEESHSRSLVMGSPYTQFINKQLRLMCFLVPTVSPHYQRIHDDHWKSTIGEHPNKLTW